MKQVRIGNNDKKNTKHNLNPQVLIKSIAIKVPVKPIKITKISVKIT